MVTSKTTVLYVILTLGLFFVLIGSFILNERSKLILRNSNNRLRNADNRLLLRVDRNVLMEDPHSAVSSPLVIETLDNAAADAVGRNHLLPDGRGRVVILSHEFSITGAPRVCAELAQSLGDLDFDTSLSALSLSQVDSVHSMSERDLQNVANLLPSLQPNFFSFRLHRGRIDGSLNELVENADVVVVSTAVIPSSLFVSRFAQSEVRCGNLVWWIHESESVMSALGDEAITCALDTLSVLGKRIERKSDRSKKLCIGGHIDQTNNVINNPGDQTNNAINNAGVSLHNLEVNSKTSDHRGRLHETVVFPSLAAQAYWVTAASRLPETQRLFAVAAINSAKIVLWGLPSWKLSALRYRGQENEIFRERERLRLDLGISKDDLVFLSLGTLHALKGHAGIIRAMRCAASGRSDGVANANGERVPSPSRLVLVTVGGGFCADYRHFPFSDCKGSESAAFIEGLKLTLPTPCSDLKKGGDSEKVVDDMSWVLRDESFHFLPAVRRIEPYFAMADVFVSNTLGGGETWGLASLEAMGAGLPVLAASRGGSLELIVDGETGLLHRDEFGLAENIRAISKDDELRRKLGIAAGKRAVEKFGDEHVVKSVLGTLQ